MKRLNKPTIPFVYTSVLYFAGLLLFLEWLYPVAQVTDTVYIGIFVMYTFFCFFISILQVKWWLSILLKGFGIIFVLNGIFSEYNFWDKEWFHELYADLMFNLQMIYSREWYDLTDLFRTLLFLIIIWLMSYLIYYWFVQIKRVMVFSVLTIIYITLLDTFTVYDANWAIIRSFIVVFLALGIANILKEVQRENIQPKGFKFRALWVIPLIVVVLCSSMVGYAAPKLDPQWEDPIQFLTSVKNGLGGSGGGVVQKVGYGEDDSQLGGSFVQDYTTVFRAYVKKKSYFRIESKDVYTGKGWINTVQSEYVEQKDGDITFETFEPTVETESYDMILQFDERANIPKLLYPYGAKHVVASDGDVTLWLNRYTGEIKPEIDNHDVMLDSYTISYDSPSYPIDAMRKSTALVNMEFLKRYTKLPDTVPERVYELAKEITANDDNQYDKVRAVEHYFSGNGFTYQTSDVAVPSEEQDYVDQFLFETKVGYCDNYSTSMVILLRTLGIPARWVKGFTSGEKIEDNINEKGYDLYEVTSANAHSWVEVYFEGVGWVPFEPTQGFNAPNDFAIDLDNQNDDTIEAPEVQQPQQPEKPEEATEAFKPSKSNDDFSLKFTWIHGSIIAGVLLLLVAIVYWKRYQIQSFYLRRKIARRRDARSYQDAYHFILKLLKKHGFTKNPDQTLREFAGRIDNFYGTDEMGRLTANYEKLIYQNGVQVTGTDELSNLWKNLIKRILG